MTDHEIDEPLGEAVDEAIGQAIGEASDEAIGQELVRSLLEEQYPDLAALELHHSVRGWDNQLWRLGDELAVRLPRTPRAPDLLRKEHRWLPLLTQRLPLPVPTPLRLAEPSDLFPHPWTIAEWVPGEPADRSPISEGGESADTLARFLRALHQEAPADAPANTGRGVPLAAVSHHFDEAVRSVAAHVPEGVRDVLDEAVAAPAWEGPRVWLHGDLHPANVVVSDGTLSGVVDFGELCAGDPAMDLAAGWLLLPSAADFLDVYERADEAMIRRARGWAVLQALSLVAIGRAGDQGLPGGKPTWGRAGRLTLDRVLASR
ncbi:aminoglycoside phosphotransferase family protein [Streptomyces sp. NPDC051956]|uniref:aminoglycoside phosphotransferase family protein n=1 Tax=Streptomyces sp. NPDC051956 TaxID=3365677 RepID=UPI0037D9314B